MFRRVKANLARQYEALRTGQSLRLGSVSLVRSHHFAHLLRRLSHAERELTAAGHLLSVPLNAAREKEPNKRRSVVFLHHSYYNFFYLAKALRARGWDALSVSLDDPYLPDAQFYHGEDLNLFDSDPDIYKRNLDAFFAEVQARFRMVHFYGRGRMSFFPSFFDLAPNYEVVPFDFLRLRQLGIKIGYSVCGCLDGVAQSSVSRWSDGACDRCIWQHRSEICNDMTNMSWGHKVHMVADVVATEGFPALDWQGTSKCYRDPLTTALDSNFWRPDLEIPEQYRLARKPGELIVYHAVGNFDLRSNESRNLKGTKAVAGAVERLRAEGMNVRLEFITNVPNRDVRYFQVQADVIVDQLNYGRYGATAREGMMLGRPTICNINKAEPKGGANLESIESCPLVSANETTVYRELSTLLSAPDRRTRIAEAGRVYALKWHSAEACAERFEQVYDRLQDGLSPMPAQIVSGISA